MMNSETTDTLANRFGHYFIKFSTVMLVGLGYALMFAYAPIAGILMVAINVGAAYVAASCELIKKDLDKPYSKSDAKN